MAGHQGFVLATAFDARRDRLCSVSIEGWASIWDLETRQRMTAWPCHDGPVLDMTVTPSGVVLTAGHDGTAGVWTHGGSLIHRLAGHDGGVHAVAGSGRLIATGSADGRIRLWDGETGQLLHHLCGHSQTVTSVAFLDPEHLISGARDRTVRLWPLDDGGSPQVFEGHDWWVTKVRPAANGRVVSGSEDCSLRVWNPQTGDCEWTFDGCPGPIWGLAVDPSGRRALIGYGGTTLLVELDSRVVREVAEVSGRAMSFSADGSRAAIGQDSGDIDLIDLAAGPAPLARLPGAGQRVLSGVAGPDLTVGSRIGGEVVSRTRAGSTDHAGHARFVYVTRRLDGQRFATGAFDGRVRVWTPGTVEPLADLDHGGLVFSLATRGDGRLLAGGWDRLSLWDVDTGEGVWRVDAAGIGSHLVAAFGAGDPFIAGVGEAPVLKLWRVGEGEVGRWALPDAHNCVIEPVPGGNLMVVGSAWGRVFLVNPADGRARLLHGEHEDWIRIARVSADGRRVLTISQNGTGRVYDLGLEQVTERFGRPMVVGDFDGASTLRWLDCLGEVHTT